MAPETLPTPPPGMRPTPRRRRFEDVETHGTDSWRKAKRSKAAPQPRDYESEENYVAECLILLARSGGGPCLSSSSSIAIPAAIATSSPSTDVSNEEKKFTGTAISPATASTIVDAKKQQQQSPHGAGTEENQPTATASAIIDAMKQEESSYYNNPATIAVASLAIGASTLENQPTATNTSPPNASATVDAKKQQECYPATPPPLAQNNSYKCNVCGETFRSHQALGGHKTRHRSKPPITPASDDGSPCNANPAVFCSISALNPSGRPHECPICHKVFPTGQALGGHKRKHYEGMISRSATKTHTTSSDDSRVTKSGVTSADSTSSHVTIAVSRNIDLNLPPRPRFYSFV
ncbi:hypothetical protein Pfo_004840 [Paulownia fortunei]|nr:hypothetical protein Pfo_004840 [Paulownia fortunei]